MDRATARTAQPIATLVANDGTAAFVGAMVRADVATRDLADAVHALCAIHGDQPGVIELAVARGPDTVTAWLAEAADTFRAERAYLAKLTAAVGPIPSTPGQAEADVALMTQRHSLDMLAQSDRIGCAFGAAAALVLDWHAIRRVLDCAAQRLGVVSLPSRLPDAAKTSITIETLGGMPMVARAAAFGAQQLVAQHRGLWQLLQARVAARHDH